MLIAVIVQDPFAEEHPADDQLLIPNDGLVCVTHSLVHHVDLLQLSLLVRLIVVLHHE